MADLVFPEDSTTAAASGDSNAAAYFASLLEAATTDTVISGLEFTNIDYTGNTFDLTAGKAAVKADAIPGSVEGYRFGDTKTMRE